jgi:hypothetical protein
MPKPRPCAAARVPGGPHRPAQVVLRQSRSAVAEELATRAGMLPAAQILRLALPARGRAEPELRF